MFFFFNWGMQQVTINQNNESLGVKQTTDVPVVHGHIQNQERLPTTSI